MRGARPSRPPLAPTLALAATLALTLTLATTAGCRFDPRVPSGVILCAGDGECPQGMSCRIAPAGPAAGARVCCQGDLCPAPGPATTDAAGNAGDAAPPAPDAATDLEQTVPPVVTPGAPPTDPPAPTDAATPATDAATPATDAATPAATDAAAAVPVTCSAGFATPIAPAPGVRTTCTLHARDAYVALGVDTLIGDDATSVRAHAVCWVDHPLGALATDPATGAGRALPAAAVERLVAAVTQLRQLCARHDGALIGAVAGGWARQASNRAELAATLRQRAGVTLDIPSAEQELRDVYLGVTRNRRGRLVIDGRWSSPELLLWPTSAPAPRRYTLPMSFAEGGRYLADPSHASFDDARRALRGRLVADARATLDELRALIQGGELAPAVAVGPASALVPLAVAGRLRDTAGRWDDTAAYRRKLAEATVTPSAHGRIFGLVLPAQIDELYRGIDGAQFTDLRSDPRRSAYGEELMLMTAVLDLVGDEAKATEFPFVFTAPHFGYLFRQLLPAP
jgi:hypothetical protein